MELKANPNRKSENRIVVDYHGAEELVLLAVIETASEVEIPYQFYKDMAFEMPVVSKYDGVKDFKEIQALNIDNKEGFVVRFERGFRMKIKFEDYCRMHRILTGVSSRTIWEYLKDGRSIEELIENVPDEFYDFVKSTAVTLQGQFNVIKMEVEMVYAEITCNLTKVLTPKQYAAAVFEKAPHISGFLFRRRENRDFDAEIWKRLYPEFSQPFKNNKSDEE